MNQEELAKLLKTLDSIEKSLSLIATCVNKDGYRTGSPNNCIFVADENKRSYR